MANIITITGDLGSGKSTAAKRLAALTNSRYFSTGLAQREWAKAKGLTTLAMNQLAETDPTIDQQIDSSIKALKDSAENLVVDSRMAWFFLPDSMKIKLVTAPTVAAARIHADQERAADDNPSLLKALENAVARQKSEQSRFLHRYGANSEEDANFDFIIDTTAATPEEVVTLLTTLVNTPAPCPLGRYWLCAKNLFPTESVRGLVTERAKRLRSIVQEEGLKPEFPIWVQKAHDSYLILDGHKRTSAAIFAGLSHVPATLRRAPDTPSQPGLEAFVRMSDVYDWEDAHQFLFNHYPTTINKEDSPA